MKSIFIALFITSLLSGCVDIPDTSTLNDALQTESNKNTKKQKTKTVDREQQMHDCYEKCTDNRDNCLSGGEYSAGFCYDTYDTCANVMCCAQFGDLNPLCR